MVKHQPATALADSTTSILTSLRAAGAHVWPTDTIKKYMDAQIAANPPNFWYKNEDKLDIVGLLFALALVGSFLLGAGSWGLGKLAEVAVWMNWNPSVFNMIAETLVLFSFWPFMAMWVCGAAVCIIVWLSGHATVIEPAFWNSTNPKYYFGPLPEEAKTIMAKLSEFRPDVTFTIAELMQTHRPVEDPVLYAHFREGEQTIYSAAVLVWDNKGIVLPPATT